ncbi:MAG: DUF4974 domain-containing protein [Cyclobacteriaceae bacterium]|nr:DUF4974 domain-containing protein [Cyclobacteriaceae bacterium SS2]
MEELIFKYLNKQLNQEEWNELQEWVKKDSMNKTILNKLQGYSMHSDDESAQLKELVWSELKLKTEHHHQGSQPITQVSQNKPDIAFYLKIAAAVLIAASVAFLTYSISEDQLIDESITQIQQIENEAPFGAKVTTKLPDGSMVTLNSGSKLSYPDQFTGSVREVRLTGEAFFEVAHNPEMPFIVRFKEDEVRVLGTSFNVRTYQEEKLSCVAVATGKVSFTSATGEQAMLTPHQMATYSEVDQKLVIEKVDDLQAFGWKDKIIYFNNKPFPEIITEIERWFGVEVEVNGDFEKIGTFSGQFKESTLNQVLKGLSFVYQFRYEVEGNQVILNTK